MKLVPINERLAARLIEENKDLTGEIVEIRTIFKDADDKPIFQMTRTVKERGEFVSYGMFMPEYKQEN